MQSKYRVFGSNTFFPLAVKNVPTKVALMQESVLKVLVFAVHVRKFKNDFLVFVPTNILLSQLGKSLPKINQPYNLFVTSKNEFSN